MRLLVQKGNYTDVPKEFLLAFWGSTDCAITHGPMDLCVGNYYGTFHYMREKLDSTKSKKQFVGKAIPYKHPKTGRKIVGLFDRENHLDTNPEEKAVKSCLVALKKIMIAGKLSKVSMHQNYLGATSLELLVHEIFETTEFDVLIRLW